MESINQAAREEALASLGIAKLHDRLERCRKQQQTLETREESLHRAMLATLRGVPVRSLRGESVYSLERDVAEAVKNRQVVHEDELLADTSRGQEILRLRKEKEHLLDTVWLATSPKQIKDLWQKVDDLLDDEQTALQRDALAIEPVEPA